MKASFILMLVLVLTKDILCGSDPELGCCLAKTVGEYSYTYVGANTATVPARCLNSCVYKMDNNPGSLYCFAKGSLPVNCTSHAHFKIFNNYHSPVNGTIAFEKNNLPCNQFTQPYSVEFNQTFSGENICTVKNITGFAPRALQKDCVPYIKEEIEYSNFEIVFYPDPKGCRINGVF